MANLILGIIFTFIAAVPPGVEPGAAPKDTKYPQRAECALKLMHTGKVLKTFVLARGQMPKKLADAHQPDLSSAGWEHLICPAGKADWSSEGFTASYSYFSVAIEKIKSGDIIVFDSEPCHEGGRNALLSDLEAVVFFPEAEFQKKLGEQKARHDSEKVSYEISANDLIIVPASERPPSPAQKVLASGYFQICAALAAAIIAVLVIMSARKKQNA